jgi:hypothetical protein
VHLTNARVAYPANDQTPRALRVQQNQRDLHTEVYEVERRWARGADRVTPIALVRLDHGMAIKTAIKDSEVG